MSRVKYWQAINQALADELECDDTVIVLGEDVGAPGGPFGATMNLQERFGAIVGASVGAAMSGLRPVVEVMFMDFLGLAMDQLVNQAAKVSYMSGGSYHVPMVLRTLCGAGRGTGPQHGQSFESWLVNVPGLKVVWPSTPAAAYGLLRAAIRDDDPVVVIESLQLWSLRGDLREESYELGRAEIMRPGEDVTLVSWGAAVHRALEAAGIAADSGVDVEVIDLCSLSPIDWETILASVARTRRLVVAHDSYTPGGIGSDIAAAVGRELFGTLEAPVAQVANPFAPVPFPPGLEQAFFPDADGIAAAIEHVSNGDGA
jgi:acetoin:2,6-dichlorophenolindophenol oxidoreductase subunit beta